MAKHSATRRAPAQPKKRPMNTHYAVDSRLVAALAPVLTPLYVKTRVQAASVPCWRMRKSVITRW